VIYREARFREAALLYIECDRKATETKSIEDAMASLVVSEAGKNRTDYLMDRLRQFHAKHPSVKQLFGTLEDGGEMARPRGSLSIDELNASPFLKTLLAATD
jgi:hypothetical protein